jgi:hypothetical protein
VGSNPTVVRHLTFKGIKMKPRNHVVLALLQARRKSGKHEKSRKAERRLEKVKTAKNRGQDYFCPF